MNKKILHKVNQNKITGECQIEILEVLPAYNFDGVVADNFNSDTMEVISQETGRIFTIHKLSIGKTIFESDFEARRECLRLKEVHNTWQTDHQNEFISRMMENLDKVDRAADDTDNWYNITSVTLGEPTKETIKQQTEQKSLDNSYIVLSRLKDCIIKNDGKHIIVGDNIKIKLQTIEFLLNILDEEYKNYDD